GRCLGAGALLVATVLADAAGDRAGDRFGVLQVGAVIDPEPVAPRAALGFADQGDATGAIAGSNGGEDLIAQAAEPVGRIELAEHAAAVGFRALHLGADLQAVA